ncbi:MAG: radical SAM family heme chaperone HemW [Chloroflexota bacterium]
MVQGISRDLSLYLHIPFCQHRCSYCDFNTYTSLGNLQASYAEGLAREIAQVGNSQNRPVQTIFLGGGTPSLMSPAQMNTILTAVNDHFDLHPTAEVSMEANPGTVNRDYFEAMRDLGINRISFGVQSVIPSELELLEREHDFETVIRAVESCRAAGIDNFNLDLIYGVPGQTLASWQESMEALLALDPTHLSLYCLTIEPRTPMQMWLNNGRIQPPDPDLAADQYELAGALLGKAGYEHYEISNWAKPGKACQHNLTYWRNEDYLGLGAGAHGHVNGIRYDIVKQPRVYLRRIFSDNHQSKYPLSTAVADHHRLNSQEAMSDTIITQLRLLKEGLDLNAFEQKFGQTLQEAYSDVFPNLIEWGMIKIKNDRLLLTENGRFLSNQVFYRFM